MEPRKASEIFRAQALEAFYHRAEGEIFLARPVAHTILAGVFAAFALIFIAFLVSFEVTRKVEVQGQIIPDQGLTRIVATQTGVVIETRVANGDRVTEGQTLFVLASDTASATRGDTPTETATLLKERRNTLVEEQKLLTARLERRRRSDTARVRALDDESQQLVGQIALQGERIKLSAQRQERYRDLASRGFINEAQVHDRDSEHMDRQQRLADLRHSLAAASRERTSLAEVSDEHQAEDQRALLAATRAIADLDQQLAEFEARRRPAVRTPVPGTLAAIVAERGQGIFPGQVLATLIPDGAILEAELYVPSRAIGFLRAGQQVLLRYQAFPYQKFGQHGGHIRDISHSALRAEELPAVPRSTAMQWREPFYRIRVALDSPTVIAYGASQALKSGMLLDASIVLEHRRLYEWVLEPLFSISGKRAP